MKSGKQNQVIERNNIQNNKETEKPNKINTIIPLEKGKEFKESSNVLFPIHGKNQKYSNLEENFNTINYSKHTNNRAGGHIWGGGEKGCR